MLVIGLLALWALGAGAAEPGTPAVTVTIVSPTAGAVVGGGGVNFDYSIPDPGGARASRDVEGERRVHIVNHVTHAAGISIAAVESDITEIGTPALSVILRRTIAEIYRAIHPKCSWRKTGTC
jgi:hypothetical protein